MTRDNCIPKIKLCGLSRPEDIEAANKCKPEYIGFVFWEKSKRKVDKEKARILKAKLDSAIKAVGVFVDESIEVIAELLNDGIIDIAQLHGSEDESYIKELKAVTDKPVIQAFQIKDKSDIIAAMGSSADMLLLDSGQGTGSSFDWELLRNVDREFFLAGGLNLSNIEAALVSITPYAVDVSSGIETEGYKDPVKMQEFVNIVRNARKDKS